MRPPRLSATLTFGFIVGPLTLYHIYVYPFYYKHVSVSICVITSYLSLIAVLNFVIASMMDPGIIPKNQQRHVNHIDQDDDDESLDDDDDDEKEEEQDDGATSSPSSSSEEAAEMGMTKKKDTPTLPYHLTTKYCHHLEHRIVMIVDIVFVNSTIIVLGLETVLDFGTIVTSFTLSIHSLWCYCWCSQHHSTN
ncbi:hypothetical protein SAMD00019534_014920 [Acytostelium subglobosum LB1]|uniref:hypothetical protein n=1 Tax=Acytostelium subglobosum LB1 TaxID=1410327 RepID=UPI0006451055|nr:hypothetical protein SAMD00019534_014920 [Acytostelium subglobosum LB1]GAM18317.1 hypothetical protein SAMD00019534_014920 [Acytostelium subglobosum LB1]|eukprot:XP_012757537.1 hypothetical protein SAMD00019534_014920 [Acytostelium subglobosum LB1]